MWSVGVWECVECGVWSVESGEWRVESGEWRVESGEWRVESGEWRVGAGVEFYVIFKLILILSRHSDQILQSAAKV